MTVATLLIVVFWGGLTAYAILGGADFGAGILHLLAPAGLEGRRQRRAITAAIGPLWEANHVWLIFFLTGLLTAFPAAFAALGSAVLAPATLALLGIVVRGAGLAFASQLTAADDAQRPLRLAFGLASAATPLVFGSLAGGLARQRLVVDDGTVRTGGGLALWVGPFQLGVGLLAIAVCTALAAVFLTFESARAGEQTLASSFHRLALRATTTTVALAGAALLLAAMFAPTLFDGLTGRGWPALLAGLFALGVTLIALRAYRIRLARIAMVVATAAILWGWGLAQFPRLVGQHLTVATAAAPRAELNAIAIALAAGAAVLAPSLWLLYGAFRRNPTHIAR
jgi:cytochrome d ubiquinol oxidase subunit II